MREGSEKEPVTGKRDEKNKFCRLDPEGRNF
jgi:hypothetical protein